MTNVERIPVLISGGGPVGMTLALELARYGVRSVLVERNPTTTRHPKMDLTNGRSMELFKRLGLMKNLRAAGVPADNPFDISWITTLAGHELHRFIYPTSNQKQDIIRRENDGSHASEAPMRVSQIVIEPVLKTAIDANPLIDVRFGVAYDELVSEDADGVTVRLKDAVGRSETIRAQYLAGCDGGGSSVRRDLGIEMDGDFNVASAFMVHFRSEARDVLQRWGVAWHYQSSTGTLIAQNDVDIWTLQRWLLPGMDPATIDPGKLLEEWVGQSFNYEILQANPWSAHFVVAQSYGRGRIALAGDAAHQFVPTGGYGMNSGIADAVGLAWVLASQLEGWGGAGLIAAYDQERRPTAWWHLQASSRHMGVRGAIHELYGTSDKLDAPGPEGDAARTKIGAAIAAQGNAENESWGVELGYRYDESPIIAHEPNAPAVPFIDYRPSTIPGARLPHVFLRDGVSIHDKLGLYFTLIVLNGADSRGMEEAAAALKIPLTVLRIDEAVLPVLQKPCLLVRPDQHVAWRGETLPSDPRHVLEKAAGRA
ncbi:MAG: FAD-dependent monooxygenase [Caulobacterales bacterium]